MAGRVYCSTMTSGSVCVLSYSVLFPAALLTTGCQDGLVTFRGSCYLFIDDISGVWSDAVHHCAAHNAHLASIETTDEDKFLRNQSNKLFKCGRNSSASFWVRGTDDVIEGIWAWHDTNEPVTFTSWAPGQPQNSSGEDCLVLFGMHGFLWDDAFCTDKYHFICEENEEIVGSVVG